MQLISVEEGWFLVQLYRGSDVMEGWVPSTYVERRWDVDLDKMNISKPSTSEYRCCFRTKLLSLLDVSVFNLTFKITDQGCLVGKFVLGKKIC